MRTLCLSTLLFFPAILFAQVRKISAETNLQNVTVFSSGAQLMRNGSVTVLPGRSEITFTGLSNQLDQQSLQLKADARITLLSVQTTKDFSGERKVEQEEKALLEHAGSLKDKIDLDKKLLEVYKHEEAMLIKNQAIGGSAGVKSAELKDALDLQRQRLTEIYQRQLEIEKRIQEQQKEYETSRQQLQEISKKKDSISYAVTALIESKEARTIKFDMLYTVKDAGWYPVYDVRVPDIGKPLEAVMNANVFQRSGETWRNVDLQLSTGNPGDNATPSQLQPWLLGFYDPSVAWMRSKAAQPGMATGRILNERGEPLNGATVAVKGSRIATLTDVNGFFKLQDFPQNSTAVVSYVGYALKEVALRPGYFTITLKQSSQELSEVVVTGYSLQGRVAGLEVEDAAPRKEKQEIQSVAVITQYQPTAVVYKIEDKYTLETDGKTTTIRVKQFNVPALYEYYTAPKVDPAAFLTAKIVDWQDYDLQSGEANLFFEGTFLGKTYIDLSTAGDTLALSLGKDNQIRVSRKLVKQYSGKKLIGNNRSESKQYETVIRNNKNVSVTIVVEDQYPVSANKEIDVDDVQANDAQTNKETGAAVWNLVVPAGQEKKLQIGYRVKYPKDKKIVLE